MNSKNDNLVIELITRYILCNEGYFPAISLCLTCVEYSKFTLRQDIFREAYFSIWGEGLIIPTEETNWIIEYREKPFLIAPRLETRGFENTGRALTHWRDGNGDPLGITLRISSLASSREVVDFDTLIEYLKTFEDKTAANKSHNQFDFRIFCKYYDDEILYSSFFTY